MRWKVLSLLGVCGMAFITPVSASADSLETVLRLQETVPMEALAKEVSDPTSSRFQQFYTPEEIRKISAPSDADYAKLLDQLRADGATIVKESTTHLFITVRAERSYLANLGRLALSPMLKSHSLSPLNAVASVNGLTKSPKRHPHYQVLSGFHEFTGYTPAQIKTAYGFDPIYAGGASATGQHIAIATYDGFTEDDVNQFWSMNKIAPAPAVDTVSFNGTATPNPESAMETELDAEFSGMMAPGASVHVFASAQNSDAGELGMFTAILDDNRAKVVNYSWGMCEDQVASAHKDDMDKVFARAVAQGVNILNASGDSGADCDGDGSNAASYPAVSPNVVGIGGTTLTITNGEASEVAWSGSGGGISKLYPKPDYQSALDASAVTGRGFPDVAFNADPKSGQAIWVAGASTVIGGTSMAAPQWSGFLALVNGTRGSHSLGFLNPIIYALSAQDQATYLRDVTSGSNGAFTAGVGWDAVTGFGSMRASELFTYLTHL